MIWVTVFTFIAYNEDMMALELNSLLGTLFEKGCPKSLQLFISKLAEKEKLLKSVVWKWQSFPLTFH